MTDVVDIRSRRQPVWYDIAVCHHWDGTVETWVRGADIEMPENRSKIADALQQSVDGLRRPYDPEQRGDCEGG